MSNGKLNAILSERFNGDIGAMAAFLGISVDELEGMLDGSLSIPAWVWEKLGWEPEQEPEPEQKL